MTDKDSQFKGRNPWIDGRAYGMRAVTKVPTTTCSTRATSTTMTLGEASTFRNGDGIVCRGAGAALTLSTPGAPTVVAENASGPTGTGNSVANSSGATSYQYCVVAMKQDGSFSPCSAITSIANGPATLGPQPTLNISSWTRTNNVVTAAFRSIHNMVAGTYFVVQGDSSINGWYTVASVPDSTHITFKTSADTRVGAPTGKASSGATVIFWMSNHVTWTTVTGAMRYYVYGRTSGAMNLVWVSHIQSSTYSIKISGTKIPANVFDDYGPRLCPNIDSANVPDYVPLTPPASGKNGDLVTTIVAGAGTTRLTLSDAATTTVSGATAKFDNAPTLKAAMTVAAASASPGKGTLFVPNMGAAAFVTNSVLDWNGGTLSIVQAGIFQPNETVLLRSNVTWTGQFPLNPIKSSSFATRPYPQIASGSANPFFYMPNQPSFFSYLTLTSSIPSFGVMFSVDQGGGIPASTWENLNLITSMGASDYMSTPFLFRSDSTGGADYHFRNINLITGPTSPVTGTSSTPAFLGEAMGNPLFFTNIFLNKRTLYFDSQPQGLVINIDSIYDQQGITPMVTVNNTSGAAASTNVFFRNHVLDTMANPLLAAIGNAAGAIAPQGGNFPGGGMPLINHSGGLTVFANAPQQLGMSNGPIVQRAIDGIKTTSSANYEQQQLNAGLSLGAIYQAFVNSTAQPAPTVTVAAGGTVPPGSHTVQVAPSFPSALGVSGEGPLSPASSSVTTSKGNQTLQISWAPVPGAVGYDLYVDNVSIGCTAGFVGNGATTSLSWNGSNPARCGPSATQMAGSGPSGISKDQIWTPRLTQQSTDGGGRVNITMPVATATRTQTRPDASGSYLLDSTIGSTVRAILTSAYTNATTKASNITGLSFSAAANTNYSWTCDLYFQGSARTAGLDITVTGPASPNNVFYSYDEGSGVTSANSGVANAFATKITGNATVNAATNLHARIALGLINGANAGTVQLQGSATGAGTVTIQPGSFCWLF
ncbi:MAG TPA: hypothetical protein VN749_16515 [Candidatus Eisenbacteria bacterium]|nr:hypothetical protein [Candidatus Eisenbacteria bacterium]